MVDVIADEPERKKLSTLAGSALLGLLQETTGRRLPRRREMLPPRGPSGNFAVRARAMA
jgi:hypothetical protein